MQKNIFLLGSDKGYTVKYSPLPEEDPEGEGKGRQRAIFYHISRVKYERVRSVRLTSLSDNWVILHSGTKLRSKSK